MNITISILVLFIIILTFYFIARIMRRKKCDITTCINTYKNVKCKSIIVHDDEITFEYIGCIVTVPFANDITIHYHNGTVKLNAK